MSNLAVLNYLNGESLHCHFFINLLKNRFNHSSLDSQAVLPNNSPGLASPCEEWPSCHDKLCSSGLEQAWLLFHWLWWESQAKHRIVWSFNSSPLAQDSELQWKLFGRLLLLLHTSFLASPPCQISLHSPGFLHQVTSTFLYFIFTWVKSLAQHILNVRFPFLSDQYIHHSKFSIKTNAYLKTNYKWGSHWPF